MQAGLVEEVGQQVFGFQESLVDSGRSQAFRSRPKEGGQGGVIAG